MKSVVAATTVVSWEEQAYETLKLRFDEDEYYFMANML